MLKPDQDYMQFLEQGRFMLQRSRESGAYIFYPRVIEPGTGCTDLEWVEASGQGTVYSLTIVRKKTPVESYNIVLIDLAEGPRMMSRVDGVPLDRLRIGLPVQARVVRENEQPMVVFVPAPDVEGTADAAV